MIIGAQFYTIRKHCKTLDDFAESLKKVADIGYTTVQISGTCEYDPQWLKEQLDKNGLKCVLTHISKDKLAEDAAAVAKAHDVFGCDYVGLGSFQVKDEDGKRYSDFLNIYPTVAKTLKENGKYFMYHNHAHEYELCEGKVKWEYMIENTDPDCVFFQMDVYWAVIGKASPVDYFKKYPGRWTMLHIKDKREIGQSGMVGFEPIFRNFPKAGTEAIVVEMEESSSPNVLKGLRESALYLRNAKY